MYIKKNISRATGAVTWHGAWFGVYNLGCKSKKGPLGKIGPTREGPLEEAQAILELPS